MLAISWASGKTGQRKLFVWLLPALGALALLGSYLLGSTHFWLSFSLLTIPAAMYAPYGPFYALLPELLRPTYSAARSD
ncbi:hypothetical protein ACQKPC_12765 [Pseudomonas sp. NPDC089918]|uniref:hypothetical protein n=1 Tax=Pseudomonas sp. NPDC089918 TaxID=3390654 RepID=UPI003CFEA123